MLLAKLLGILTILFCFIPPSANAELWALLIGINKYNHADISALKGCETDVELMSSLLIETYGFPPENIKTLRGGEATREGIIATFEEWLIKKPKRGDLVVFHFSGHGSQVDDKNDDESDDGCDEILCPVDLNPEAEQVEETKALLDDELNALLNRIPTDNVIVILDCCHSGTATRSLRLRPKRIELFSCPPKSKESPLNLRRRNATSLDKVAQNHVLLSGCTADQVAIDAPWESQAGEPYHAGVFTKSLVEVLQSAPAITCDDLMDKVSRSVRLRSADQTPQLEGDGDRPVFAIRALDGRYHPLVASKNPSLLIQKVDGNLVTINAGFVRGVTQGSAYEIFPQTDVNFTGAPIALMQITSVERDQSLGKIVTPNFTTPIEPKYRAVESSHAYRPDKLYLQLDIANGDVTKFRDAFSQVPDLVLVEEGQYADVVLKIEDSEGNFAGSLISGDGIVTGKTTARSVTESAEDLKPGLENALVIKRLINLVNPNPPFKIEVWMDKGKTPVYYIGELATFKFKSEQKCYLTLFNVDSKGKVSMLFPNKYHPSNEVVANQTYTIPSPDMEFDIETYGPPGKQLIKAIATTVPLDIAQLSLDQTEAPFLSIGGASEVKQFMETLSRRLVVEGLDEVPANTIHLPTTKFVTGEVIAEIREAKTGN